MPQITIDFTQAQAQRISDAFTSILRPLDANNDPRQATADDVKEFLMNELRQSVRRQERTEAQQAHESGIVPLDLT